MLDFDRFAQIKRIGGEPAALRQLLAAKDKGAQPREIVDIAKEIELSATSLARLRALLGVSLVDEAPAPKERRKKARPLDRHRERRAMQRLIKSEGRSPAGFVAYPINDEHTDVVLRLFGAFFDRGFDLEDDQALFVVRESDDDKLWLCAIEREREAATRVSPVLAAGDIPTRVDEDTFASLFPSAPAIDEIETEGLMKLIVRSSKGF
jgi:hypothetical protein